jgi:flagellar biosynthetic protein FliR
MNTYFIIDDYLFLFLVILFRIGGFFLTAPYFSLMNIPNQIKIILTISISFIVIFYVPSLKFSGELSVITIALKELIFGASIGWGIKMIFLMISGAGEIIGQQGGFAMARLYDPLAMSQTNVIANFLNTMLMLVFLSIGGHLIVLQVLLDSYYIIPMDMPLKFFSNFDFLIKMFIKMFSISVRIAAPSIITVLATYIALGIMTKVAPKMNIFSLSFSVNILVGLILFVLIIDGTANIMVLSLDTYIKEIMINLRG